MASEEALFFECAGDRMLGILHQAQEQQATDIGVLLVVGGPQYRVGSHRQFVLLARALASAGIPVLRFDYRGMGDSVAAPRDFERISEDIRAAMDILTDRIKSLRGVVLWGLCDAATANAFYAGTDSRVVGQIALNPWVRTSEGEAQAFIKHYYLKRVCSRDFWRKVIGLDFDAGAAFKDFLGKIGQSSGGTAGSDSDNNALPERMRESQTNSEQPTLLILSGQDLTAREYESRVVKSPEWRQWMASSDVTLRRLHDADHTFSRAIWRDQVATWSRDWILGLND